MLMQLEPLHSMDRCKKSKAGLVGITPIAGFVTPIAILIVSITAVCCFYTIIFNHKTQVDDSLDTFPVHVVGGTVGTI